MNTSSAVNVAFESMYARWDGATLVVGNTLFERAWTYAGGLLAARSFLDKGTGQEWCEGELAGMNLWGPASHIEVSTETGVRRAVEAASLRVMVLLTAGTKTVAYTLVIFADAPGVLIECDASTGPAVDATAAAEATGVETSPIQADEQRLSRDVMDGLVIDPIHVRLGVLELMDRTDLHDTLLFEKSWLLTPAAEPWIETRGNVFYAERVLDGLGLLMVRHAPLPHARGVKAGQDLIVSGKKVALVGHGVEGNGGAGYAVVMLAYSGGRAGRVAAMQTYQRCLRQYEPKRDGLLLSNTWGDRNKDGRVNEAFIFQEVAAGEKLGVDVVQIDDGWQRGRTANSIHAGGVWDGFWKADANFWAAHPERFPRGVGPVIEDARKRGMQFGLWYAPDSSNDFANWERDANQFVAIHREHGVNYFKLDGIKLGNKTREENFGKMVDRVMQLTNGAIVFDLDVTAETRGGYLMYAHAGTLFVENRYTDWHRYWPHRTLRNLWHLSQIVDPVRLRMEFLNITRRPEIYPNDPLAPSKWPAATVFATVMMCSPLAWCEVSNLPPGFAGEVSELVKLWRNHRADMFEGPIVPIGGEPDGVAWTGFLTGRPGGARYLLAFRELNTSSTWTVPLDRHYVARNLAGGFVTVRDDVAHVQIDNALGFAWARLTPGKA